MATPGLGLGLGWRGGESDQLGRKPCLAVRNASLPRLRLRVRGRVLRTLPIRVRVRVRVRVRRSLPD